MTHETSATTGTTNGARPENPFAESFNGRLRDECLRIDWFMSLRSCQPVQLGIADPQPQFHLTLHSVEQQIPCTRPFCLI